MSPLFTRMSPLFQEPWDIVPSYEISRQNTACIGVTVGSNLPLQHQSWPQKNDFEKTEEGASDYCFIQYRNEEVY